MDGRILVFGGLAAASILLLAGDPMGSSNRKPYAGIPLSRWRTQFFEIMKTRYGLDAGDCPTDEARIEVAWTQSQTPSEYADWLGERHDLQPLRKGTIW